MIEQVLGETGVLGRAEEQHRPATVDRRQSNQHRQGKHASMEMPYFSS
jgi:hypothetical protein